MKNCPSKVLALALKEYAHDGKRSEYIILDIAGAHPNLDVSVIEKYFAWGTSHLDQLYDISHILVNRNIPMSLFEELVDYENKSAAELYQASESDEEDESDFYYGLALGYAVQHPNCSPKLLCLGAQDTAFNTRADVARHPKVSQTLARKLLHDVDDYVQATAIRNPRTPIESVIQILANFEVHSQDMKNAQKVSILHAIVRRVPSDVEREHALELLSQLSSGRKTRMLKALYTTVAKDLDDKCYDKNASVRKAATRNPRITEEGRVTVALLSPEMDNLIR
jgi:hypothetical protein